MNDPPPFPEGVDPQRAALERALGAQYRIVRLLGRGGMGSVFLAREQALDRLVAIKVLSAASGPDRDSRERFKREARTAAGLSHANIVPLHGFGEIDGMLYLVMGFVSGESLRDRLKRDQRLPELEVRRILADVAEALDYAHRHNVVHRDVKPDNILIEDETGRAFLADFGIAKGIEAAEELTQVGQVVGTPLYMSPEQAAGKDVDGRSDLYSLGAVAFTMLAGRVPFETKTMQEAILRRHTEDAPPLGSIANGVPVDLAAATDRCLAREPEKRFKDARAFRQAVAPDALIEDELPEPLDTLDGKAVLILGLLIAIGFASLSLAADEAEAAYRKVRGEKGFGGGSGALLQIALWAAIVMQIPILSSAATSARRRGFSSSQILGAFFRQPRWWPCFWFPQRFRRIDDVWGRLPGPFRMCRVLATIFAGQVAWMIGFSYIISLANSLDPEILARRMEALGLKTVVVFAFVNSKWLALLVVASLVFVMVAAPISIFLCARLMRRQGFDTYDLRRVSRTLLMGPTSDKAPWRKPEVARLLLPVKPRESGLVSEPQSPTAIAQALSRLSGELTGQSRSLTGEAAESARRLGASLVEIERGIARLTAELDPKESESLKDRIKKLEPNPDAEDPDRRELRDLLQKQLALFERRADRREEAAKRRARLQESVANLWKAARGLRPTADPDPATLDLVRLALNRSREPTGSVESDRISSTNVTMDRG